MTFTLTTTSTNNITLAAFRSPFTFSDILTPARHLGDSGSSTGPIAGTKILTFQTIVPANTSIALVVNAVDSGVGVGTPYTLDVTSTVGGSPCGTGIDIKVYTSAAVPIPDNVPTGVDVTLPVSGIGRIRDMNFRFIAPNVAACNATPGNVNAAVDHTFVGDLRFKLTSPKGTAVTFMANRGGARDNICNTTIIDKFGNPLLSTITNTSGQFISGFFQPEDTGRLSNFTGENADGIWTLNVSDTAGNDTGNLRRFALQFNFNIFSFNDFDNDGTSDLAISRVNGANREWWYRKSNSGGAVAALVFGSPNDKITPADFTGDGRTDVAFWRPSNGNWFILRSEDFTFYAFPLGSAGDIPVPANYDGDGKTDAAVFRPVGALWYVNKSAGGTLIQSFGLSTDAPVPADYDGDNKADLAIFRQNGANKEW